MIYIILLNVYIDGLILFTLRRVKSVSVSLFHPLREVSYLCAIRQRTSVSYPAAQYYQPIHFDRPLSPLFRQSSTSKPILHLNYWRKFFYQTLISKRNVLRYK